jgi:hypothetical protein
VAKRNWTTERLDLIARQQEARDRIVALETEAGIRDGAVRAHEGPFFPISYTNPEMPRADARDMEYDYRREAIRDLYFKVTDDNSRKALIAAQVEFNRGGDGLTELQIHEAREDLSVARRKSPMMPWIYGALVGVMCVVAGQRWFGTVGLVGGGVAGVLLGLGISAQARAGLETEIRLADASLAELIETNTKDAHIPPYFTAQEAATGVRDTAFDRQSAMGNRARR